MTDPDRTRATDEGVIDVTAASGCRTTDVPRRRPAVRTGRARAAAGDRAPRAHRDREAAARHRRQPRRSTCAAAPATSPARSPSTLPAARVWASDLTDGCVELDPPQRDAPRARRARHGRTGRSLRRPRPGWSSRGTSTSVVCNPPYISTGRLAGDRAGLLDHEPREAFDGGPYGLSIHQRVIAEAPRFLKPGGWLLMEFGLGQHRQVKILLERARQFVDIEFVNDGTDAPRVVAARLQR